MRAVVWLVAFLEFSVDAAVDPDDLVKQLESVAYELQQLDAEERRAFIAFVRGEAEETDDPEYRDFLLTIPAGLGLVDE